MAIEFAPVVSDETSAQEGGSVTGIDGERPVAVLYCAVAVTGITVRKAATNQG